MPEEEDLVLGKIAIQMGLITPGQLDALVRLSKEIGKPVGAILMEQGAIQPTDLQKLIDLRKISVSSEVAQPPARQEAIVLARQIVREGYLTPEEADECLRDHVIDGERRPFEQELVDRGIVTQDKIDRLKSLREERPMHCPACGIGFKVKSVSGRSRIDCPKCKGPLVDGKPPPAAARPAKPATVAFKTEVMKALEPDRPAAPTAAKKMKCQCMICDALFDAAPDENGRVKCPQCGSSFEPRE
jgi:predicted Zn-ribbon and HTH transcriptional regulator